MNKRQEYLKHLHTALDRMQVKASLAKLEMRDVKKELAHKYDDVRSRMSDLSEATDDRWDATREGLEAAWHAFRERFHEVMELHRGAPPEKV